jgi:succinate dehydrogenase / fumarate reductase membrane anchor subunit
MSDLRTPLAKARGLGAAKSGAGHFIAQRVSAVALIVLVPIFCWSLAKHGFGDYAAAIAWIGSPLGAIVTLLTLTAAFYHMRLGLQVVIEDYIHKPSTKFALLLLNTFIAAGLWLATLWAILSVAT